MVFEANNIFVKIHLFYDLRFHISRVAGKMLRLFCLSKRISRTSVIAQCTLRLYHQNEFIIQSDFFDAHPIDRQTIDALAKLDSERKSRASIEIVRELYAKYENETNSERKNDFAQKLRGEFKKFPNRTHPTILTYGPNADNKEIDSHGNAFKTKNPDGKDYVTLCELLNNIRLDQLGNFTGPRSYYFMHGIAELVGSVNRILNES